MTNRIYSGPAVKGVNQGDNVAFVAVASNMVSLLNLNRCGASTSIIKMYFFLKK